MCHNRDPASDIVHALRSRKLLPLERRRGQCQSAQVAQFFCSFSDVRLHDIPHAASADMQDATRQKTADCSTRATLTPDSMQYVCPRHATSAPPERLVQVVPREHGVRCRLQQLEVLQPLHPLHLLFPCAKERVMSTHVTSHVPLLCDTCDVALRTQSKYL